MLKGFIFDLDGTLFNTSLEMSDVGNRALSVLGFPALPPSSYTRYSGHDYEGFFRGLLRESAGPEAERFWERFCDLYTPLEREAVKTDLIFPYEGMPEALLELRRRGMRLAVYSNKDNGACREAVGRIFEPGLFDLVQGMEEGMSPKPDPSGGRIILEKLGLQASECVYVGDTEVDMMTGKAVGFHTAAALWGYRDRESLLPYGPDVFLRKPVDLLSLLPDGGIDG